MSKMWSSVTWQKFKKKEKYYCEVYDNWHGIGDLV